MGTQETTERRQAAEARAAAVERGEPIDAPRTATEADGRKVAVR